ncbi:VanZ family protein [Clostridium estertheticum]|uniref:VanZ family protein n=1 Tax=Clostridium estertheticum TaxID=238834 RepID=UPI0013E9140C|nr:VanZ family protein [Clostridium estertheticum]MBZ9689194.1 VanZ family protein [Clostridium estertheticum]
MRKNLKTKTIAKVLLCVIWLCVIFYNGTRQGETSQKTSKEVIKVASTVMNIPAAAIDTPGVKFNEVNYYVRKNAHFFQYFIFSIFLCSAAREFKLYKISEIFLVLFFLLLFPVIDEFIQKFVPGRTSLIFDVIIDFSGGVIAMLIYNICYKFRKKKVAVKY